MAPPKGRWGGPLALALSVQAATSVVDMTVPVLGPAIAAAAGVPPSYVGYYASAAAGGAILFYLFGAGLVRRVGPRRILQMGIAVCAGSLLLVLSQHWGLVLIAGALIGLGFGTNAPASGLLLHRTVPQRRRRLAFSIKQAGVPLGALLAGAVLPVVASTTTWQTAVLVAVALGVAVLALVELSVPPNDTATADPYGERNDVRPLNLWPLLAMVRLRPLRRLMVVGALLAVVQGSLGAFLVTYLVTELDRSLVLAGGLYAIYQAVSIPGRILSGWLGDRRSWRTRMLAIIGIAAAASVSLLTTLSAEATAVEIAVVVAAVGLVSGSWNGVLLAEVAEAAPDGRVAEAQNVAAIGLFAGFLAGPFCFALLVPAIGFQSAFLVVAAGAVLAALAARRL